MKKIGYVIVALIASAICYFMAYSVSHYQLEGIIKPTNNKGEYLFIDHRGYEWNFYAEDKIKEDTIGYCKFYDNMTTDYIEDDKIVDYQILDSDLKNKN